MNMISIDSNDCQTLKMQDEHSNNDWFYYPTKPGQLERIFATFVKQVIDGEHSYSTDTKLSEDNKVRYV